MRALVLTGVMLALSCCAMPPAAVDTGGFVQQEELAGAGLVREGLAFLKQARFIDAEFSFRRALYLFPDADNVRENLALALVGSGQYSEADAILRALVQKYPKGARHWVNLAQSLYQQSRYEESREAFSKGLEVAFERKEFLAAASILRSLAFVARERGDGEASLCYSADALALKPDITEAISHARMLLEQHRYAQVAPILTGFTPATADLQFEVARLHGLSAYGVRDYQGAVEYARRARDLVAVSDTRGDEVRILLYFAGINSGRPVKSARSDTEEQDASQERLLQRGPPPRQALGWPINLLRELAAWQVESQKKS